jgi:hypothetical protein
MWTDDAVGFVVFTVVAAVAYFASWVLDPCVGDDMPESCVTVEEGR